MQWNTKLNIFLKFIKIDTLSIFLKKDIKKGSNIKLLKNKQFTNQYRKYNNKSNMLPNLY